jgi:hypothetical protein
MEIHPVEAELFHADGQTEGHKDLTELIDTFHNFVKAKYLKAHRR